jgi:hypothetical protein
MDVMV